MKRLTTGIAGLLMLALAGCGGQAFNNDLPNIYAGDWTGTWTDTARGDNGGFEITINDRGIITGRISRINGEVEGNLTGTVSRTGQFTATGDFAGPTDFAQIRGTLTYSGPTTVNIVFNYRFEGDSAFASGTLTVPPPD